MFRVRDLRQNTDKNMGGKYKLTNSVRDTGCMRERSDNSNCVSEKDRKGMRSKNERSRLKTLQTVMNSKHCRNK